MQGLKRYYGQKLAWYAVTFFVAILLNFLLPRLMPGDPVSAMVAGLAEGIVDPTIVQQIKLEYVELFGLDRPLYEQFGVYISNLFRGDLGTSFSQHPRPVADIIAESVLWTLGLQIPAIFAGWIIGNTMGVLAAYFRGFMDKALMPTFMFISNLPAFGLAIIMLWIFGMTLRWTPVGGGFAFYLFPAFTFQFIASLIEHWQLPFWTMVLVSIGTASLGMRAMSIYELNSDYVKYSRFLGLRNHKIVRYVFRNAMLPQVTGLVFALGGMMVGNLVAEIIFNYPGIGTTLLAAIRGQDYPLISATALIITIMILVANLVVEIIYGLIDPRIKATQQDS